MVTICKVCGEVDTAVSNGDCGGCSECYSIEQGFLYVETWEYDNRFSVDEDGNLYLEGYETDGPIGSILEVA